MGLGSHEWYHVAVVIGVDLAGCITLLRRKPNANRCVSDAAAAQFETVDPVSEGELCELWRIHSLDWYGPRVVESPK